MRDQFDMGKPCRYGTFVYPQDEYIGKALDLYGEYSDREVVFLTSLLRPGDIVVEAGANVGAITVPLAVAVGLEGRVYAFEPQADIALMLATNVRTNMLENCIIATAGLSDEQSLMHYDSNALNTGGVTLGSSGKYDVQTLKLDNCGVIFESCRLIKVDVEGMETQVLRGARETIKRCKPFLYVENDRSQHTEKLLNELYGMGYRVWRHDPPLFNPSNYRNATMNVWPNVVSMNLICVHQDQEVPDQVKALREVTRKNSWVAVCRFGGVGDNLIAASVLPMLARRGYKVEVITNKLAGAVFENNPFVDKLSICEDDDQPSTGSLDWYQWFVKRGHEYAGGLYHLSHTVETTLALVEAQCQFWWSAEMRRKWCNKSYLEMAADVCGLDYHFNDLLFYPSTEEWAQATQTKEKMGERVVGWVLGGSRIDKIYPQSAWAIARIIKELELPVMMSGAPGKDFELASLIQKDVIKQNGTDAGLHLALTADPNAPNWPLRRSLTQLMTCDLVVGPDTGGMWAVSMAPMPKIMMLSHASPENITKHWNNTYTLHADPGRVPCWPCHRLHDRIDTCVPNADKTGVACMSAISVELLMKTAKEALHVG
jgi:FkbM family methyltransferase